MELNDAFTDETRIGVTALGADNFRICQRGGGYFGKHENWNRPIYYLWSPSQEWVNDELGSGELTSAPAIAGPHIAARGKDGNIWYKNASSNAWEKLPSGSLTSAPAICMEGKNLYIFARALNNQLWHISKAPKGGWTGWSNASIPALPSGMKSAPSIASPKPGRIDIVAQGGDDQVWHLYYDNSAWSPQWDSLGGTVTATPTCCWWGTDTFHVFARATDFQLYHKYFDWSDKDGHGRWHNPNNPADNVGWANDAPAHPKGGISSAPVAVVDSSRRVDIFARGGGAEAWNIRWASGTGWQQWKPIRINSVFYPAG